MTTENVHLFLLLRNKTVEREKRDDSPDPCDQKRDAEKNAARLKKTDYNARGSSARKHTGSLKAEISCEMSSAKFASRKSSKNKVNAKERLPPLQQQQPPLSLPPLRLLPQWDGVGRRGARDGIRRST